MVIYFAELRSQTHYIDILLQTSMPSDAITIITPNVEFN